MPSTAKPNNLLLAALPKKTYQEIFPKLERIPLIFAKNIYETGGVIKNVYFPESGIISLLSAVDTDSTLEVGIVGNEGMVGLPLFLGEKTSNTRALVQGAGFAWCMSSVDFLAECKRSDELPRVLRRFTHMLMTQISLSAACNRFHPIDARLARWLLMTQDRMKSDEFQITQEFLSNMLGVRREAVSKTATVFQHRGFISYVRGHLSIHNRKEMKSAACNCYGIISNQTVGWGSS